MHYPACRDIILLIYNIINTFFWLSFLVFLYSFVSLKRLLTILLLLIFLTSGTELYQLFKLPFLVEHYLKHKEQDRSISLFDFLALHYKGGIKYDEDYDSDMKLPFKTCCHGESSVINAVVPQYKTPLPVKVCFVLKNEFYLSNVSYLPSSYLAAIWQPPKFS